MKLPFEVDVRDVKRLVSAMDTYRSTLRRKLPTGEPMPQGVTDLCKRLDQIAQELEAAAAAEIDAALAGHDRVPVV